MILDPSSPTGRHGRLRALTAAALVACASAQAADEVGEGLRPPSEPAGIVMPERTTGRNWDASIGLVGSYAPEYAGADRSRRGEARLFPLSPAPPQQQRARHQRDEH